MSGDAVVELVQNAIGYGVMLALEGRTELVQKLQSLPPGGSLADALRSDAEGFVSTRADLVDAVVGAGSAPACCCSFLSQDKCCEPCSEARHMSCVGPLAPLPERI